MGGVLKGSLLAAALLFAVFQLEAHRPIHEADSMTRGHAAAATVLDGKPRISILLLGTSLTHNETWPDALRERLAACADRPVDLERIARPGATSLWGRDRMAERAARRKAPAADILIVEFMHNDAAIQRGVSFAASRAAHLDIFAKARADLTFAATMTPVHGPKRWARPFLHAYEDIYRRFDRAGVARLIDGGARWRAKSPREIKTLVPDGLHPTDAAMRDLTAPAFFDALRPYVCG